MRRAVTIRDVAKAAGVSVATVCDVLNENPRTRVAPDTRQRIFDAANALEYRPNHAARSLRTGLNYLIGLSIPLSLDPPLSPFSYEAVAGAVKAARERGWMATILGYRTKEEELALLKETVKRRMPDGVLLFDPCDDDPRWPVLKGRIPFVAVGRCTDPEIFTVDNDNVEGARLSTRHLARLGHRDIGLIDVPLCYTVAQDRLRGYREALAETGVPFRPELCCEAADYSPDAGYRAALELLDRPGPRPTAVAAMDDMLAMGVIQAAQQRGLRVPYDLAVVGFNDARFTQHSDPPLTTIHNFADGVAYQAAELLIRLVLREETTPQPILMPTKLVMRQSCGAALRPGAGDVADT